MHVGKYVLEFLFLKKHKTLEETFHPVKEQKGYASSESVSFKNKKQIILKLSPSSEFKVCAFWHWSLPAGDPPHTLHTVVKPSYASLMQEKLKALYLLLLY